jgi:large subunit ribosomal protein L3
VGERQGRSRHRAQGRAGTHRAGEDQERDGYSALQVTYGHKDAKKLNKPEAGHFTNAGVQPGRRLVELRLDSVDGFEVGQTIGVDTLATGELVDVTASARARASPAA